MEKIMNTINQVLDKEPEYLLKEWDELDEVIHLSEELLERLRLRRSNVEATIDELTRPSESSVSAVANVDESSNQDVNITHSAAVIKAKFISRGFQYKGKHHSAIDKIDIHIGLIKQLLQDYPEQAEDMLSAIQSIGRTRNYLSRNRYDLFEGKTDEWTDKYSKDIGNGWYLDSNLNEPRMRDILQTAVKAVGLRWNEDVIVYWRSRRIA
jgi:hypothetical protein